MTRIPGSHPGYPGSRPGQRIRSCFMSLPAAALQKSSWQFVERTEMQLTLGQNRIGTVQVHLYTDFFFNKYCSTTQSFIGWICRLWNHAECGLWSVFSVGFLIAENRWPNPTIFESTVIWVKLESKWTRENITRYELGEAGVRSWETLHNR